MKRVKSFVAMVTAVVGSITLLGCQTGPGSSYSGSYPGAKGAADEERAAPAAYKTVNPSAEPSYNGFAGGNGAFGESP